MSCTLASNEFRPSAITAKKQSLNCDDIESTQSLHDHSAEPVSEILASGRFPDIGSEINITPAGKSQLCRVPCLIGRWSSE